MVKALLAIDLKVRTNISVQDVLKFLNGTVEFRIRSPLWSGDAFYETNCAVINSNTDIDQFSKRLRIEREAAAHKICLSVDEWIDSGKDGDQETAGSRHESNAPEAAFEAATYWKTSQSVLDPATPSTLRLLPEDKMSFENAQWQARRIIALVFSSDLRLRIAKCRYKRCRRPYFLHNKPHKTYEYGLFCCIEHNRSATAPLRVKERRRKFEQKLIQWSTMYVQANAPRNWRTNMAFKEKLAQHLSRLIAKEKAPPRDAVTKNWITRNLAQIDAKSSLRNSRSMSRLESHAV